jgi:hypothetical protein
MHKVEKCLDGPLLPKKTLRGKGEPRLVKEKNTPVPRLVVFTAFSCLYILDSGPVFSVVFYLFTGLGCSENLKINHDIGKLAQTY